MDADGSNRASVEVGGSDCAVRKWVSIEEASTISKSMTMYEMLDRCASRCAG